LRRAPLLAIAAAVVLLAPAAAAAQDPVPAVPTPAPTPTPAPPPKPRIALAASGTIPVGHDAIVLSGSSLRLRGKMTPAVKGERVKLKLFRDGRPKRAIRVRVRADGTFARRVRSGNAGRFSVRAYHVASKRLAAARGPKVSVGVYAPQLSFGDSGALVRVLQRGLAKLRYAVPRNDHFDALTAQAVLAYRNVNGLARRWDADRHVIERVIAGRGMFKVRHPEAGHHVEADISRQVLALIDGDRVVATYHTSSGAPATPTIIGSFRVYLKTPGTNAKGMVHSTYFIRGYAIHGYFDVPAFNASHGCLRVPIPDAWRIFTWLNVGDRVIVYP
jgi:lipoprotein-anchoring transpeptidase ErfK/SrfK